MNAIRVIEKKCHTHSVDGIVFGKKKKFFSSDSSDYFGICIYAEHREGKLSQLIPEIISVANGLKKQSFKTISVILLGSGIRCLAEEILLYGIDEVWMVDSYKITDFAEDVQAELLYRIIKEKKPEILLGGSTVLGRSLFPRLAAKLNTGLTADCTELVIDHVTGLLVQTRPAYGGNMMASILCKTHRPQMATIRSGRIEAAVRVGQAGKIVNMNHILVPNSKIISRGFYKAQNNGLDFTGVDFIVSGGKGLNKAENFDLIEKFAKAVGGKVGASRAAVDAGWVSYEQQVGQSGKTVKPQVYIACGISGAFQHMVGVHSSAVIIAINIDPNAPIFDMADYGIIGDLFEVVPEIIRQLH